ncbi:MAG: succinyl-diaminopimelate desuccinylase [Acidimicrobiales bacterium]|jgi:succinyl-diaminopimelate desuccinylase
MRDLLAATADLVNRTSVSFEESDFVDWIEAELTPLAHLDLTRIGDNLIARTNLGHAQRLLLVGHTDTVPVNANGTARIEGDTLWGVGSADMKGGLACFLELARSVSRPAVDLTYVFYAREEVGQEHNGLKEIHEHRPDLLEGDCAILGEPTDGAIEAGCQGAMRLEVTLAGERAHTARPWMGRNAVHRLAPILTTLAAYEARTPTIDGCIFRESVQAVHVAGGVAGNVVPDSAMVRIHHRYAPDRSAAEAEQFIRDLLAEHLDVGDSIEVVDQSDACAPSLTHPLLRSLIDDNNLTVTAKLGWTDVARFAAFGVPATNFGSGDAVVAHTQAEHLNRESIERTYAALYSLVTS